MRRHNFWTTRAGLILLSLLPVFAGAAEVGTTAGVFSVTPAGAATYSIPITVPPGTAGMQPKLSIEYNSQGGNGPLGMGFGLSGLSAISRCPATLDQDGFIDGVDFDTNDRFCLDGQRLVAISGEYGVSGAEYRTEIESFSKVVSYNSTYYQGPYHPPVCESEPGVPTYCEPAYNEPGHYEPGNFKVWTKSGLIMEFGATADSRIEAQGKTQALVWALNKISDTTGNYLNVSYSENNASGEFFPTGIQYTGNSTTGTAPYNSVSFVYLPRSDVSVGYVGGSKVTQSQRLSKIQAYASGALVREYRTTYDQGGQAGRSRVVSIRECSVADCLQPTTFSWPPAPQNNNFSNRTDYITANWGGPGFTWTGDFNGDGRSDIASANAGNVHMKLATSNGFNSQDWPVTNQWEGGSGGYTWVSDFDGNGLTDIASANGGNVYLKLSTGSGFTSVTWPVANLWGGPEFTRVGDFNGDGRADIASASGGNVYMKLSTGTAFTSVTWRVANAWGGSGYTWVGDFDGDGLSDIASASAGSIYMKLSTGNGFNSQTWSVTNQWEGGAGGYTWLGDFNGDGLSDIASANGGNIFMKLSTGAGFTSATWVAASTWGGHEFTRTGDFNGDGLTDIASANGSNVYLKLSTGSGFASQTWWSPAYAWGGAEWTWTGDFNGDGLTDIASAYGSNIYRKEATGYRDFVAAITNGLGAEVRADYLPLTSSAVYSKGQGSIYPVMEIQAPMYVVSDHYASNGLGGLRRMHYYYWGSRVHLRGRGWLGFSQFMAEDKTTLLRDVNRFKQTFPFIGIPDYQKRETTAGFLLSETIPTMASNALGASVFPYTQKIQAKSWEMNTGQLVTTTVTDNTYGDSCGNLTTSAVRAYAGDIGASTPFETFVTNTFPPPADAENCRLGRLSRSHVTRQGPGITPATRTSSFEYDSVTGLLSAEIIEPDNTPLKVRTVYPRDGFGNVIQTTVSGSDFTQRTTTKDFDPNAPNYGRFNTRSCNALSQSHCELRTFDPATGNVLSTTGPNGLVTSYSYDVWGRASRESFNQHGINTWKQIDRRWCSDSPGTCRAGEIFFIRSTTAAGGDAYAFFDILERQTRAAGKIGSGAFTETRTEYDVAGRITRTSSPYFSSALPQFWTSNTYDVIGRVLQTTSPVNQNNPTGCVTRMEYRGLVTTGYDCLNRPTTREVNALGKLVRVADALQGSNTYGYDAFENLVTTRDPDNATTTMVYNIRGHKLEMTEPNMGRWTYGYNALGELIRQQDAKGQVVTMAYDLLGRMTSRVEPDGTSTWTYDTLWKGALTEVLSPSYRRSYGYKPHGAVASEEVAIFGGNIRRFSFNYDGLGRMTETIYPTGLAVYNRYNASGAVECVYKLFAPCYWEPRAWDHWGRANLTHLSNGVDSARYHDPAVGHLDTILTGLNNGTELQSLNYIWDAAGNLTSRTDQNQNGLREDFVEYDAVHRLKRSTVAGSENFSATYSASGNLLSKTGVGNYVYAGGRPHATSQAGANSYSYDANGNLISGGGASGNRQIYLTSYNLPWRIEDGSSYTQFHHGAERQRVWQISSSASSGSRSVYYYNGLYEEHLQSGTTYQKHHITTPDGVIAIETWVNGALNKQEYLHKDHLGSVETITNASGQVVQRLSFDAFGKRRNPIGWAGAPPNPTSQVRRGFTGHEHLDDVGLIHMNGRVYDPQLGRFISADPFVSAPADTQSYNRYSYVRNNPLALTDPSGFSWWGSQVQRLGSELRRWERDVRHEHRREGSNLPTVLRVVNGLTAGSCGAYAALCGAANEYWISQAQGASDHDAGKNAGITAIAILGSQIIGEFLPAGGEGATTATQVGNVVAHGVLGGVTTELGGGTFRSGFYSGAFSAAAAPYVPDNPVVGAIVSATIGGTASELGGGKFANGAVTAAFAMTLRSLPDLYAEIVGYELDGGPGGAAVGKDPAGRPVKGANNIGTQQYTVDSECVFCASEGSPISRGANHIPGINAVAGMHDIFQISYPNTFTRNLFNIPGMPVAAVLTYGGFLGMPLAVMTPQQIIFYSTSPAFGGP